jgi:hypothetical protein
VSGFRDVEDELNAAYPVPALVLPAPKPPRVRVARRVLGGGQGVIVGLQVAIITDQLVGLATPIPAMVNFAVLGAWVWPDRRVLARRAVAARTAASYVVSVPFWWWPI